MKKISALFILLLWFQSSCNKCRDIACTSPPETYRFKILDKTGQNITSTFTNAVFTYLENGLTKETKLQKITLTSQEAVLSTDELGWISSISENEVVFDLVLDEKKSGKLICKVIRKSENCCSFFETEKITFNGNSLLGKRDKDFSYLLPVE
ncbi:MAG: hypothetical protein U0X91_14165 [Spirosomataceae bacterium]